MTAAMRVGILGGSFDPPHLGHEALARAALTQLALDRLLIMPTGEAWYKTQKLSPAADRLAMCHLAFDALDARVQIDARETQRTGPSYTVDTLRALKAEQPAAQLYLIMGDDQWRSLPRWHHVEEIGRLAIICPAYRDPQVQAWGDSSQAGGQDLAGIEPPLRVRPLSMAPMPQSATAIRQSVPASVSASITLDGAVSPAVAQYIQQHHLYRSDT